MKKVSIIVPFFNTAAYIRKCVESILNQTYRNIEIVLVDDGSTDGSREICEQYCRQDCRIVLVAKPHTGQADSRYAGFGRSTGDYIYCVDSDDSIEPHAVELLVAGLEASDADMYLARYRLIDEKGRTVGTSREYTVDRIGDKKNIVTDALCIGNMKASLCLKLCRRFLWEKCYEPFVRTLRYNEDYLLTILFCLEARSVAFSNEIVYNVLRRRGSVSRRVRPYMLGSHDECFSVIAERLKARFPAEDFGRAYHTGFGKNLFYSMLVAATVARSYGEFRGLCDSIAPDSIYRTDTFRRDIGDYRLSFRILDMLSRRPRLFFMASGVIGLFFKH